MACSPSLVSTICLNSRSIVVLTHPYMLTHTPMKTITFIYKFLLSVQLCKYRCKIAREDLITPQIVLPCSSNASLTFSKPCTTKLQCWYATISIMSHNKASGSLAYQKCLPARFPHPHPLSSYLVILHVSWGEVATKARETKTAFAEARVPSKRRHLNSNHPIEFKPLHATA